MGIGVTEDKTVAEALYWTTSRTLGSFLLFVSDKLQRKVLKMSEVLTALYS